MQDVWLCEECDVITSTNGRPNNSISAVLVDIALS